MHSQGEAQGAMSISNQAGFHGVSRKGYPEVQPPSRERKDGGDYQGTQRVHRAMRAAPGRGSLLFSFGKGE